MPGEGFLLHPSPAEFPMQANVQWPKLKDGDMIVKVEGLNRKGKVDIEL